MSTENFSGTDRAAFEEINRRYQIEEIYHTGAHCRILRALAGEQMVAIHIPQANANSKKSSGRWARLLRGIQHAGLPRYVEDFETVNGSVVVTEWINGTSLAELFKEGRYRHTEHFSVQLLEHAARVLTYLHGLRPPIVHGSVGPKNWFLNESGRLVLLGFSDAHDDPRHAAQMAEDVYELAQTGLLLVTGLNLQDITSPGQALDLESLQLSKPLARLLTQCLDQVPQNRPRASEFAARISSLLSPIDTSANDISYTQRPIATTPSAPTPLPIEALELVSENEPEISIDTITLQDKPKPQLSAVEQRHERLTELWNTISNNPADIETHELFAKFAVESSQYQEAAEMYREFERNNPKYRELGEKYRQDIAIKAASRIIASQPKAAPGPQAVAGFAKWSLIGSSAGLMVSMLIQSWVLALLSGPVFAFGVWARFRARSGD